MNAEARIPQAGLAIRQKTASMKSPIRLPLLTIPIIACGLAPIRAQSLASPDGATVFNVAINAGQLQYNVAHAGVQVLEGAPLGLIVDTPGGGSETLSQNVLSFAAGPVATVNQDYAFLGQTAIAHNYFNERTFTVTRAAGSNFITTEVQVRAYNDGVAFRYLVPGAGPRGILGESTGFGLPAGSSLWYITDLDDHEGNYSNNAAGSFSTTMGGPVTVQLAGGRYLGITEGNVRNYSGMRLRADSPSRTLTTNFWDNTWGDFKFDVPGGAYSPWRTVIVADDLTELVNSTIVSNVSDAPDPALFADQSWIRPGKSLWSWLSEGGGSTTYTRQVDYINLADELDFDSILIDSGWESRFTGFNGKTKYQNLADLVDYGEARGVDVWVWKHIARTDTTHAQYDAQTDPLLDPVKREFFFAQLEAAGVAGIKIDFVNQSFFDPDDASNRSAEAQAAIQAYEEILADAAEHRLMINFHGATKPTGFERTYPNEMTREGIRGLESGSANQRHNSILPFTRLLAGHADYTPTAFATNRLTNTGTTFAHQLALGGLFTSAVTNFGFTPGNIDALEAAAPLAVEYLKALPAVWDETLVLDQTVIGQRALMARRTGTSWFLVGINGTTAPMTVSDVDLSFLGSGHYEAVRITDNTQFAVNTQFLPFVTSSFDLDVSMIAGGGFVVWLRPATGGNPADLNSDGAVDGDDVAAFVGGWKTTGWTTDAERRAHGDLNFDGQTNLADVHIFRQALALAGASHLFTGVPEPASALLLAVAVGGVVRLGVRRALPCGGAAGRG